MFFAATGRYLGISGLIALGSTRPGAEVHQHEVELPLLGRSRRWLILGVGTAERNLYVTLPKILMRIADATGRHSAVAKSITRFDGGVDRAIECPWVKMGFHFRMRSMGSGFTVKLLGSLAFACVVAASEPELFGLAAHAPSHVNYVYAAPWIVAALLFGGAAWGLAKDAVSDAQTRQNVRAMDLGLPFALLLRPFNFDGSIMVANPHKSRVLLFPSYWSEDATIPFERLVAQGIQPNLQLRALGGKPVGPGVLLVHDKDWRSRFHELAPAAKGILLIALPGREISWELAQLREHGLLDKTVVFVPSLLSVILSAGGHRFQKTADVQIVLLKFWAQCRAMGFDLPAPGRRPAFVYLDHAGRTVDKATPRKLNYRSLRAALSRRWDIPTQTASVPLQGQLQGEAVPYDEHLTELMFYAARGDLDQIKTLVAAGNEVNARSVSGYTALMYAARNNHADVASFLLSSGADPSLESSKGSSAAAIAARHGHTKLAALLERRAVRKMRLRRL